MKYPDLELDEDLRATRREWLAQRIAWIIGLALLICVGFNLLGTGRKKSAASDRLHVRYDSIVRQAAPYEVELTAEPRPGAQSLALAWENAYLQRIEIVDQSPPPVRVVAAGERQVFHYDAGDAPVHLRLRMEPLRPGRLRTSLLLDGANEVNFSQLALP